MNGLPRGTVTFLFTDIEGSTRMLERQPAGYGAVLERHRALLREAFAVEGGIEVDTEGDSFFVVFGSAIGAVRAAVAGQRALHAEVWPDGLVVRVRMGLVSGEAEPSERGYVGRDVHRAARLSAVGHGGQILLSEETRALVGAALAGEIKVLDLGQHHLRDLANVERIFQVVADGLPGAFPSLRTDAAAPTNLPASKTSFLGRAEQISEVSGLLERERLVTLVGPGGVGKTRLALEVARRLRGYFAGGVFFVPLAPLREVDLVIPAIAGELGLPDRGGREPFERLVDFLADQRVLLVLDNFEHLLPAADHVSRLIGSAAGVSLLVTSRGPVHLYGEQQYPVPTLAVPDVTGDSPAPEDLAAFDSVSLFVERARAVSPRFTLTAANGAAVAAICARLDGLPLAIEIAAARINVLSPQGIAARIDERLSMRTSSRDLPERQHTLRDTIAWSHDLLRDEERDLFAWMSVFVGGASGEAAERVLGHARSAPLEGLGRLVENSLVQRVEADGEPRFSMLETIREFAADRLADAGQLDAARARHAQYFAELVELARTELLGANAGEWLDRLERDHDNLRSVLAYAVESSDAELALRTCAGLWRFWQRRGYLAEGLARTQAALQISQGVDPAVLADGYEAAGGLAYWQADAVTTRAMYEQALALRRALGDVRTIADALYNLSFSLTWLSLSDSAARPEPEAALRILEEALELFTRVDDQAGVAKTLWGIATSETWMGRLPEAKQHVAQASDLIRRLDDSFLMPWVLYLEGLVALGLNEVERAGPALEEALTLFRASNDVSAYALVLDALAAHAVRAGDRQRAARLSGAVAELEATSGTGLNRVNRGVMGFDPDELRQDPELDEAWAAGAAADGAEVVAYALSGD